MTDTLQLLQILRTRDCAAEVLSEKEPTARDTVLCQCCGESFSLLKRHLQNDHNMDETTYRHTYSIPDEEMLVSLSYTAKKRRCIEAYGSNFRAKM